MHLTVLGNSCGRPADGCPASGYLVRSAGAAVLLDCGPGVATALSRRPFTEIDGIFVSHAHYDHFADLLTVGLSLLMDPDVAEDFRIPLYLPPGARTPLARVAAAVPFHGDRFADPYTYAFDTHEYTAGASIAIGDLTLTPLGPNEHSCPAWALRIEGEGEVLAYSGDGAATSAAIGQAARAADLFLCEAIRPQCLDGGHLAHMSAAAAGRLASESGARALLLTHTLHHDTGWRSDLIRAAATAYSGPLGVAEAGALYGVRPFTHLGRGW